MDIRTLVQYIWTDWEVLEKIGEGSFGSVYKARRRDIVGESFAAIKVTTIAGIRLLESENSNYERFQVGVIIELTERMDEALKGLTMD